MRITVNITKNDIEILAPAGSFESLKAGINAGADAIYIGGGKFGARAYADNPDEDMLIKAIDYVHLHNKKIYLTVNTLLKNKEIDELYDYLLPYYEAGLDAVIVQDLGVFKCIKNWFPDLDIHASTQMTITGLKGAKLLKELGATRIVTARELSAKEILRIHNNLDIEIESFVHGALCYCYSGQCLMSSMLGGRSGNRGRCAQPCRLAYDVIKDNRHLNKGEDKYILSPKDMCTIKILPDIIKAGVYSLKIEGRMKSPEYTAGVVSIYRKYVDKIIEKGFEGYKVSEEDYNMLEQLYSRSGFNQGYYNMHNGKEMMTFKKPSYSGKSDQIINRINELYIKNDKKIKITGSISIYEGCEMSMTINLEDKYSCTVTGAAPSIAMNKPTTETDVRKQITKTGATLFEFEDLYVTMSDNLFVQVKELNNLRRLALTELENMILSSYRRRRDPSLKDITNPEEKNYISGTPAIRCLVPDANRLKTVASHKSVDSIFLPIESFDMTDTFIDLCHNNDKKLYLALPYIFREPAKSYLDANLAYLKNSNIDGFLIRNVDELFYINENFGNSKKIIADYYLYSMNDSAHNYIKSLGADELTESLELNYKELRGKQYQIDDMIVYGYIPLMITAGCINKNTSFCNQKETSYTLRDRYNKEFIVKNICKYCYNIIYNSLPLSMLSVKQELKQLNPKNIRLQFLDESDEEIIDILNRYSDAFLYDMETSEYKNTTRGHFKRGVE